MINKNHVSKYLSKAILVGLFGMGISSVVGAKIVVNGSYDHDLEDINSQVYKDQKKGDGYCTLREALQNHFDLFHGLTLTFPDCIPTPNQPATAMVIELDLPPKTVIKIVKPNYPFWVSSSVRIRGPYTKNRKDMVTISGEYHSRVLRSGGAYQLSLEQVAVAKGYQDVGSGAGVLMESGDSILKCYRCSIMFNRAQTGDGGGIWSTGVVDLVDANVDNNFAQVGGAVSADYLTVTESNFVENIAQLGGGAVHLRESSTNNSTITKSYFSDNTALGFAATDGRIGLGGGAMVVEGKLDIEKSIFIDNRYAGGMDDWTGIPDPETRKGGGAIHFTAKARQGDTLENIRILDSEFKHNQAGVLTEEGPKAGCGGAILNEANIMIMDSGITDNAAWCDLGGGGLAVIGDSYSELDVEPADIILINTVLRKNAALNNSQQLPVYFQDTDGRTRFDYEGSLGPAAEGHGACFSGQDAEVELNNTTCEGNYGSSELYIDSGGIFSRNSLISARNTSTENCSSVGFGNYNFKGIKDMNNILVPFYNIQGLSANQCPGAAVAKKFNFVEERYVTGPDDRAGIFEAPIPRDFLYVYPYLSSTGSQGADPKVCHDPETVGGIDLLGKARGMDICTYGAIESKEPNPQVL